MTDTIIYLVISFLVSIVFIILGIFGLRKVENY